MTNTMRIESAVSPYVGKTLTAKQVIAIVIEKYPDANASSIMVSDHAGVNSKGITYADQLFTRSATGYVVRAAQDIVRKPKTARSKQSMTDALASAKALLALPVIASQQQSKPNGKAAPVSN